MILNSSPARSLSLFYCYAHEDAALRDELDTHLARESESLRSNRDISEGGDWHVGMDERLDTADLLLLLVTEHLIASGYCDSIEMQEALKRHEAGEFVILPILLRAVNWQETALGMLATLPRDGRPVLDRDDRDEALKQVWSEVFTIADDLSGGAPTLIAIPSIPANPAHPELASADETPAASIARVAPTDASTPLDAPPTLPEAEESSMPLEDELIGTTPSMHDTVDEPASDVATSEPLNKPALNESATNVAEHNTVDELANDQPASNTVEHDTVDKPVLKEITPNTVDEPALNGSTLGVSEANPTNEPALNATTPEPTDEQASDIADAPTGPLLGLASEGAATRDLESEPAAPVVTPSDSTTTNEPTVLLSKRPSVTPPDEPDQASRTPLQSSGEPTVRLARKPRAVPPPNEMDQANEPTLTLARKSIAIPPVEPDLVRESPTRTPDEPTVLLAKRPLAPPSPPETDRAEVSQVKAEASDTDEKSDTRNPYKGLRAFATEDAGDFFGRTQSIDELALLIESMPAREKKGDPSSRLLAVLGPAGAGKSSVVMAGLIPSLHEGGVFDSADWIYLDPIVPGEYPLDALARTLLAHLPEKDLKTVVDDLQYVAGLHSYATQLIEQAEGESTHVVLVIDQFEELFTLSEKEERRHFVNLLVNACTRQGGPLIVILTLRVDFTARLAAFPGLSALVRLHQATLSSPTQDDLQAMIVQPAHQADVAVEFEDGLVDTMLADARGLPEVLPQLQFTLHELFQRRADNRLSLQAYNELGGIKQAIARRAEQVYRALPSHEHRLAAYTLFLNLVDLGTVEQGPAPLRVLRADFKVGGDEMTRHLQECIDAFVEADLLHSQEVQGRGATVEISHEVVLRAWPRLATWIRIAREDKLFQQTFARDVAEWEVQEQAKTRLYRGAKLKQAKLWATRHEPNKQEMAFLQASTARRSRLLRNLAIVALLLLVLLGVGIGYYINRSPSPLLVTNTRNSGTGSLRWCVDNAPTGSTITFDLGVRGTIVLSGSSIATKAGRDLTIKGPGAGLLAIRSESGQAALLVPEESSLTLSGLSFRQSKLGNASMLANNGILTLNNTIITSNTSSGAGGAISSIDGALTLNNSTISGNSSTDDGGGIHLFNGTLTLNNSTIAQNSATGRGGGIYISGSMLTMNDSTISGNTTRSNAGGGIYSYNSTLLLRNDTIGDNRASSNGGGIFSYNSTVTLDKSTVFNNTSGSSGGGISVNTANSPTAARDYPVTLERSIVAGNHGEQGLDVAGTVITRGYNMFEYFAGATFVDPQKLHATDKEFNEVNDLHIDGVLDKNGGTTLTHALLQGSPAINAIPLSACDLKTAATDQRGVKRPQGNACDIGAYEYQAGS